MTIGSSLQRTIRQSNLLTTKLEANVGLGQLGLTEGENQAMIQLGILLELRAIRLVLQAKD